MGGGGEFGAMDVAEGSSAASAETRRGSSTSSASTFFFPPAAQPEVMRAAEKDEHYVASLCDACHEAFRHAMGGWSVVFVSVLVGWAKIPSF